MGDGAAPFTEPTDLRATGLVYETRHAAETGLPIHFLESGEDPWLAFPVQRDDQESAAEGDALRGYAFFPDGSAIVVSYGGGIWRGPVDGGDPVRIPFSAEVSQPDSSLLHWRVHKPETVKPFDLNRFEGRD